MVAGPCQATIAVLSRRWSGADGATGGRAFRRARRRWRGWCRPRDDSQL